MSANLCCLLLSLFGLLPLVRLSWPHALVPDPTVALSVRKNIPHQLQYGKELQFNIYTFTVTAPDSGLMREAVIKAYRGELLLTNFRVRVDGAVVGAEVADLDGNRFPELYVYSTSAGSGSLGRVYAWQFMPERKASIALPNWQQDPEAGYMGHDSLWVERDILCRKYPIYRPGDANAEASGGYRMVRYRLTPAGNNYALEED